MSLSFDRVFADPLQQSPEEEAGATFKEMARKLRETDAPTAEYDRQPLPVEEWLSSPYYVGSLADPDGMWPAIRASIVEACKPSNWEIIIAGAIGVGKTRRGAIILMRLLYELSCYKDPAKALGLAAGSPLSIAFVSVSKQKAKEAGFNYFVNFIYDSPYFMECFPPDPKITGSLKFPKHITASPVVTNAHGVISNNLIGLLIDEAAFMKTVTDSKLARGTETTYDQGWEIYSQATTRMTSRFEREGVQMPGKVIIASSAQFPDDLVSRRILQVRQEQLEGVFVSELSLWEAKPPGQYSKATFPVEVGDELAFSRILQDGDEPRPNARIINFPINFRDECEMDLERALRDLAGVPLLTLSPLITDRSKVLASIRQAPKNDLPRPTLWGPAKTCHERETIHPYSTVTTSLVDGHQILKEMLAVKDKDGMWRPRVNPEAPRFIHLDPAFTEDKMGLAMCHPTGYAKTPTRGKDGVMQVEDKVEVYVDFVLQIKRPDEPGSEIPWTEVEKLVDQLTECGFFIVLITMDSPHARFLAQRFNERGYFAEILSVDRTIEPYITFRSAINEGRVSLYDYQPMMDELFRLEFNRARKKIDHPRNSSKDVIDAVCGAVFNALTRFSEFDTGGSMSCTVLGSDD